MIEINASDRIGLLHDLLALFALVWTRHVVTRCFRQTDRGRAALQAFERSAQAFRNYRAAHCNWWSVRSGRPDLEQKLACEIDLVELRMRTLLLE